MEHLNLAESRGDACCQYLNLRAIELGESNWKGHPHELVDRSGSSMHLYEPSASGVGFFVVTEDRGETGSSDAGDRALLGIRVYFLGPEAERALYSFSVRFENKDTGETRTYRKQPLLCVHGSSGAIKELDYDDMWAPDRLSFPVSQLAPFVNTEATYENAMDDEPHEAVEFSICFAKRNE
eukprot:COSAG06_NODE_5813_length_3260_cov_19.840240_2_plen_181_part_00